MEGVRDKQEVPRRINRLLALDTERTAENKKLSSIICCRRNGFIEFHLETIGKYINRTKGHHKN
jgi:hypothetical protein